MAYIHICPKHGPEPCPAMKNIPDGHACARDATYNERTTGKKWEMLYSVFPLIDE